MPKNKVTFSVIKADIGSVPGHNRVHPNLLETARKKLKNARKKKLLIGLGAVAAVAIVVVVVVVV